MVEIKYLSDMTLNEKVLIGIVRCADTYKKKFGELFKNYGLTFPQYGVLRILDASLHNQNTITNIAKIMSVTTSNITRIVQLLERDGFLLRKMSPDDERVKLVEITPKGVKTLKNILDEQNNYLEITLEDFSDELKEQIVARIRSILKKEAPESFPKKK